MVNGCWWCFIHTGHAPCSQFGLGNVCGDRRNSSCYINSPFGHHLLGGLRMWMVLGVGFCLAPKLSMWSCIAFIWCHGGWHWAEDALSWLLVIPYHSCGFLVNINHPQWTPLYSHSMWSGKNEACGYVLCHDGRLNWWFFHWRSMSRIHPDFR